MGNPTTGTFFLTGDNMIDSLTNGYRWNLDASRTVDFSVSGGLAGEFWTNPSLIAQYLSTALQIYSDYANIKFNYVGTFSTPIQAAAAGSEINLSLSASKTIFPSSATWAIGLFPGAPYNYMYQGSAGDVFLNINSQANTLSTYAPGSAGWALLIHELGHVLGLKHPHDNGGTGRPTFSQVGQSGLNVDLFTVMSYGDAAPWNVISWDPATPMFMDVLALQALYGKNLTANAGNTTFKLVADGTYATIWDASGEDTLDGSNFNEGLSFWLPIKAPSNAVDTQVGTVLPASQTTTYSPKYVRWIAGDFENVIGTGFADDIRGNRFNNKLTPGPGSDVVDGDSGIDTCIYSSPYVGYSVTAAGSKFIVRDNTPNRDGADLLTSIERLQFSDKNIALDAGATQSAGQTALLLGAVLPGKLAFDASKQALLGSVIGLFDQGYSLQALSGALLRLPVWDVLTGKAAPTKADIAGYLVNNVYGGTQTAAITNAAISAMNDETPATQGAYLASLAVSAANQTHVDLVGIQSTGLSYIG